MGAPDTALLQGELRLAGRLDARFFALLRAVEATGSLHKAALAAGYSYKGAWLVLETAANLAHAPLVERSAGGRGGGGSTLTPAGRRSPTPGPNSRPATKPSCASRTRGCWAAPNWPRS